MIDLDTMLNFEPHIFKEKLKRMMEDDEDDYLHVVEEVGKKYRGAFLNMANKLKQLNEQLENDKVEMRGQNEYIKKLNENISRMEGILTQYTTDYQEIHYQENPRDVQTNTPRSVQNDGKTNTPRTINRSEPYMPYPYGR